MRFTFGSAREPQQGALGFKHYLSPVNVWALSFGCIIGFGAFVMAGTTFLPDAGPLGTLIGLTLGLVAMLVISLNYQRLCVRYPDSGGTFAFTQRILGYDHAFLCAWALTLAYLSLIWANATAFVLIARSLAGSVFQVGYLWRVAGYDIYLGEVAVTVAVLLIFGLLACGKRRVMNVVNTTLAFVTVVGAIVCFGAVVSQHGFDLQQFQPAFSPSAGSPFRQVVTCFELVPFCFMGFETVSHASGELRFPAKRLFGIVAAALVAGTGIYLMMLALAVFATPEGYASWFAYIAALPNLDGLAALPAFYAMQQALGTTGVNLLGITVLSALSTSLIGFYRATGRLFFRAGEEGVLPPWFAQLNADAVPRNAIGFIMLISMIVPFVGRAAIGWITDVTAVSAALAYGYTSICATRLAREAGSTGGKLAGYAGLVLSVAFLALPFAPSLWSTNPLAPESYLIVMVWSIVGLVYFREVFRRDTHHRFGTSSVVWIFLLFLIFSASTMWMGQMTNEATEGVVASVEGYIADEHEAMGVELSDEAERREAGFLEARTEEVRSEINRASLVQMALLMVSLVLMFNLYALLLAREKEQAAQRREAEAMSAAKTAFLSNMSHDIRTPMNAVIGYTHLARRDGTSPEEAQAFLGKIDASSKQLLALINDVLEMSRIESGKMELAPAACDLAEVMAETRDLFSTQMGEKGIAFSVEAEGLAHPYVVADANRLNRVLLNLVGNAYKFTPSGGEVRVRLAELGEVAGESDAASGEETEAHEVAEAPEADAAAAPRVAYELTVADTGIGMTAEFAEHIFEAFERERNAVVEGTEGTGLGMAITKSIVDLMGGEIALTTAPGEGTTFTITLAFEPTEASVLETSADVSPEELDFTGKRILIAEDNEINREIASFILEDAGFEVDTAENGRVAVETISAAPAGTYDAILMDVRMPEMDGYEATRAIRALPDAAKAAIPIVAASANAFAEDVAEAKAAGMNAHIAKPLDVAVLLGTLAEVLSQANG